MAGMTTPTRDTMTAAPDAHGVRAPGNRLPDETHIGSVHLDVADVTRSLEYYRDVLGFRVTKQETSAAGTTASLAAQDDDTTLIQLHEQRGANPVPRTGRLGLYHFAILLPNRAALGRFVVHLAARRVPAGMSDHLVSEAIYLRDPDGLGIEVYADRPRDSWRWTGGELAMTTEPLDVDDLVAAAGDIPWAGMPAGTTVGHVHLHVGDLPTAADFYHAALGLDAVVWRYPGALFLSAGGYHHHLGLNTWAAGAPAAREGDARLREWELVLPDADAVGRAVDGLERAGHRVERGADGVRVADPWGTTLRLVTP